MPKDSALPIVLCADESYIKYASVVMISVLKATKARVRFYLLSDGALSKASLDKLSYIESTYPNASISHSCHSLARFASLPTQGENDSHITYLRLLLDSILPQSVSKCVYLDCDVLVCADIAGLFSYELHGALLGAVRDLAFNDASSACRNHLGFYFNAGVLLLDMEKWRESKASRRLFHLIATRPEITQGFHDQNLLNECFCDEVCELPFGWNVIAAPPHILRFADKDSALGEQFDKIENFVKGTTAKVANLPQNFQNLQSPTATPRILEEESQAESKTQTELESNFLDSSSPSLRDTAPAVARQSTLESSVQVDSRIVDEKSGLCEATQGRALGVRNRRGDEAIADLSLQAESTKEAQSMLSRHSRATYESALESPYIVHFAAQPKPWGRVCYIKQTHSTLELIEYASPHTKQWWEVARKSPFFTEILRAFIAPTLQAYKTKAIFAAKTKAPRIYSALHALARLFTPSNPSHKEA
ncbi:glycosyltransferase family 8 protein [Helicobacter zhangjianzhongii]|uniref:glycosyltransferase family 8 protein n=1 Tax=Helicobacter zhangjianzhongii TaxID=2974574 RepID=UPI0025573E7B|nr:glycosyltransferase family 8 protein [Helicobacter sp. CPD2-1]MDL0079579.1 glycosyltransferase family 8 protein [Helicobacter sp. CPD2-1]